MFEKCDWSKYLINIPKQNYQSNNTCVVTFVFDFFFSSCNPNIHILIVTKLFNPYLGSLIITNRDKCNDKIKQKLFRIRILQNFENFILRRRKELISKVNKIRALETTVINFQPLTIIAKLSILDDCCSPGYLSVIIKINPRSTFLSYHTQKRIQNLLNDLR